MSALLCRAAVVWGWLLALGSGLCVTTVLAGDWPQWGGSAERNLVSGETSLAESFEREGENIVWTVRLGSHTYGNPTIADGRVFVGTDAEAVRDDPRLRGDEAGSVLCLSEATGELQWRLVVPQRRHGLPIDSHFMHQNMGVCSSPTVDGDRAYVVTSAAEILCLDVHGMANGNDGPYQDEGQYMAGLGKPAWDIRPQDADIIWRFDPIDQLSVMPHDAASCSVLIHGDYLYASSSNGVGGMKGETFFSKHAYVVRPGAPAMLVLDKRTGQLVARERSGISARIYHGQWSSPSCGSVNGRTLIFFGGGDGFCYAFEALTETPQYVAEMKLVWWYDCNPPAYRMRDGKEIAYYDGDKRKKDGLNRERRDLCGTQSGHRHAGVSGRQGLCGDWSRSGAWQRQRVAALH